MSFSVAAQGSRARISRSAFKTILLTTTAITALTLAQTAARADGGTGGAALHASSGGFGGAGGTGFAGNAGSAGSDDAPYGGGGGGGGGAGGGTGGQGGAGDAGTNAAGGTAISPDGANGDDEVSGLGGGGGGGGHGGNHGTVGPGMANTDSIIGGNGGNGGTGGAGDLAGGGGGGGGGAGGYGVVMTGNGASSNLVGGIVTGGNGGDGGTGGASGALGGDGGNGGDGGIGVTLTSTIGASFVNFDTVSGGNGGNGGNGGASPLSGGGNGGNGGTGGAGFAAAFVRIDNFGSITGGDGGSLGVAGTGEYLVLPVDGADGAGGAGIVGSDLNIYNYDAIISGGLGGDGVTRANAITFTGGNNKITFSNSTTGLIGNIDVTGTLTFDQSANDVAVDNLITGTGAVAKTGTASVTLSGNNTYTGGTTVTGGTLAITNSNALGSGTLALENGTALTLDGTGLDLANNITVAGDPTFTVGAGNTNTISGVIADGATAGDVVKDGDGTLILSATNTYTGGTTVNGGTLAITNSDSLGSGTLALENGTALTLDGTGINLTNNITVAGDPTFTVGAGNTNTISGVIADGATAGDVVKDGDGTLILSGTNTYTGATTVDAGTLDVTGSIASSSLTTINAGGTLIGTGTVGNMVVASGGTFAPGAAGIAGGSTTVSGTLTLDSGSNYLVAVDPTSASYANVSGTASLAGTAIAAFDTGSYAVKQYTVLTSAGLGGTTFDSFATTDLPSGFAASLEYTSTDVLLDLTAALGAGDSLNANQQNVASGLNVYFNNGGTMPSNFLTIFGLNGGNLATALSQLSGEVATAGTNGSFQLMDQFLGLMSGASSGGASSGGSLSFAPGRPASIPAEALAYAETPDANEPAVGGWSYWGSAFGGWNRMDGDSSSGANTARASSYGLAMGADFHYGADTVMGFALAYGRTEWELSNSLGGGDSDALQFGVHGKTNFGPAYLSAAAGLANHWMTTDRYAVGDHLKADFRAQVYSGRLEAGYRLEPSPSVGLTPYAALQLQHFRSPSHTEEDLGGGGFALSYDAMNVTDTRTELGARVDHTVRLDGKLLKLGAGLAWAHDHSANSSVTASFASLPGSSFSVRGVSRPENAALLTGSAEVKLASGWTLAAHVDSEQGSGYRSYAGRGTLTYAW